MPTGNETIVNTIDGNAIELRSAIILYDGRYVPLSEDNDYVEIKTTNNEYARNDAINPEERLPGVYALQDEVIWCEFNNDYYLEKDTESEGLQRCQESDEWYPEEEMKYGHCSSGHEGWFYNPDEYVYCDDTDEFYSSSEVANNHDVRYCDGCGDYRHYEDHDFDYCEGDGEGEEGSSFDNTHFVSDKHFQKTLGIDYTFGVELETDTGRPNNRDVSNLSLKNVSDGSIRGWEYVTGTLQGNKGIVMLENICKILQDCCTIQKGCGVHVHIGGAHFNRRFSMLAIMLGLQIEEELYNMMPSSRRIGTYSKPIPEKFRKIKLSSKVNHPRIYKKSLRLLNDYVFGREEDFNKDNNKKINNPNGRYSNTRYKWLNLNNCSYKDGPETIEFRQHGGSLDFRKIYNWVIICMCITKYIENNPRDIYWGHIGKGPIITLPMIINEALPKEDAKKLITYINKRTDKFM